MKLQRLRALRAIMKTGSVTRAADAMNLTQPAVSRLIGGLEEDVGFALFVREQGRLLPTSEGELFFQRVEHVLAGVDDLARIAQEIGSHRQGSLVLLCTPQAGYTIFPEAIGRFAKRYPNIRVDLHIVQRSEVGHAARATPYDMGFTVVPFDNPNLSVRRTFTIPATAVVRVPPFGRAAIAHHPGLCGRGSRHAHARQFHSREARTGVCKGGDHLSHKNGDFFPDRRLQACRSRYGLGCR
jgi:DNA-binding transcriptional LysR family regulator